MLTDNPILSEELICQFINDKLADGLKEASVEKLKLPVKKLYEWLGDDKTISAEKLLRWRKYIEEKGYSKNTVYAYVKYVNNMLRHFGYDDICIPKATAGIDISGKQFGYLTAVKPTKKRYRRAVVWQCVCKCGNKIDVPSTQLISMNTTSCGCLNIEILEFYNRNIEGTSLVRSMRDNTVSKYAASGYTGVMRKGDKWQAYIYYKKKRYNLGTFKTIEEAVKARAFGKVLVQEDAEKLFEETKHLYIEMPKRPPKAEKQKEHNTEVTRAMRDDNTSGYTGVSKQYGKWNASISYKGYRYRLGAYEGKDEAIKIRKKAEKYIAEGNIKGLKEICTNWKK